MDETEDIDNDLYKEIPIGNLVENLENYYERIEPNGNHFRNLRGWLIKPDYKREQQQIKKSIGQIIRRRLSSISFLPTEAYNLRWFHLNSLDGELCYYDDEDEKILKGKIFIREVRKIQYSIVSDAPRYSLDLVSDNTLYTIGCKSYREMVTWALAIILELRQVYTQSCDRISFNGITPNLPISIYLVNGKSILRDFPIQPTAKVCDVVNICISNLNITDHRKSSFGLFVYDLCPIKSAKVLPNDNKLDYNIAVDNNDDLVLAPSFIDYDKPFVDVLDELLSTSRKYKIVFKKNIFLSFENHISEDPIFEHLLFLQAEEETIITGNILIESEYEVLSLSSRSMTTFYGSALGNSVEELIEQKVLDFIPPSWRFVKSQIYWAQEILKRRKSILNILLNCKVDYLEKEFLMIIKKNKYYGMHWFYARKVNFDFSINNELPCPKNVIIGINDSGFFIFSTNRELIYNFQYNDISQFGVFPNSFLLVCGNHFKVKNHFKVESSFNVNNDPLEITFGTNQAEIVSKCYENHIVAIMNEYRKIPITKLAESFDDENETIQNNFKGWLLKPDFKRHEQLINNNKKKDNKSIGDSDIFDGTVFGSIINTASSIYSTFIDESNENAGSNFFKVSNDSFNLRWFCMNSIKGELNYYEDDTETDLRGSIFLREIKSLQYSILQDVPIYSLDLVSEDKYYTITCHNRNEMIKWSKFLLLQIQYTQNLPMERITESKPTFNISAFLINGKTILKDLPMHIDAKVSRLLELCLVHLEITDKRKNTLGLFLYDEGFIDNFDRNSIVNECSDLIITPSPLSNYEMLYDIIQTQVANKRKFKFVLKRKIFVPRYTIPTDYIDEHFLSILYLQAFDDVVNNRISISNEMEVLNLTYIAMMIELGDKLGNTVQQLTEQNITHFMSFHWKKKKSIQAWCDALLQIKYQEEKNINKSRQEYIFIVSRYKRHDMHIFYAHYQATSNTFSDESNQALLPVDVVVGINPDGLTIFDSSYKILYEFSFFNLISWTNVYNKLNLSCNYSDDDKVNVVSGSLKKIEISLLTTQANSISKLITDCIEGNILYYTSIPIENITKDVKKDLDRLNPGVQHLKIFKGWLAKTNYKRQQNLTINADTNIYNTTDKYEKSDCTIRWFSLNSDKGELNYFQDDSENNLKGKIPLRSITKLQYSILNDAPKFSLDLVTKDKYYTIICRSYTDMVQWCLCIQLDMSHRHK